MDVDQHQQGRGLQSLEDSADQGSSLTPDYSSLPRPLPKTFRTSFKRNFRGLQRNSLTATLPPPRKDSWTGTSLNVIENGVNYDSGAENEATNENSRKKTGRSVSRFFSKLFQQMAGIASPLSGNYNSQRKAHPGPVQHSDSGSPILRKATTPKSNSFPTPSALSLADSKSNSLPRQLEPTLDYTPGVAGLRNHGNTCFINAVLQCLSHTDLLAEYFVLDLYKQDLCKRNKLNARKYGTKGEVTEQLALLLKALWTCRYDPEISNQFKNLVDKYGNQYRGAAQHDAQEFLLWLLDKVHEDLNTATKKKYKKIRSSYGRPDEVVAAETLANHLRCNSSFVQELFQAQFRSSLTCPHCDRQSATFDPFLCVSIPISQKRTHNVFVTVLYLCQQPRQVRLGLSQSTQADVRELREALVSDTSIEDGNMLLVEIDAQGFRRTFAESQPITSIRDKDPLFCIELPTVREANEEDGAFIVLCWVNMLVQNDSCERFGSPYCMQISRETSYADLQKLLLKEMAPVVYHSALVQTQDVPLFRVRVFDGAVCPPQPNDSEEDQGYLDPSLDHPLYAEAIDTALALCDPSLGVPAHVKLVLEWDRDSKQRVIMDDKDSVEEHASVKLLQQASDECTSVTLEECFELYTQAEQLGPDDLWHCPWCNRKQEGVKKLGLWTLPDILVVHLKRFRQSCRQRTMSKLSTMVDFPITGLDMTSHLATRPSSLTRNTYAGSQVNNAWKSTSVWSPFRRQRSFTAARTLSVYHQDDNVYDLYAVCNHHGKDLQSGHYTAYCKNGTDGQWYLFDDTQVTRVDVNQVVTAAAYILFYQRRTTMSSAASACSEASSSSSGGGGDHWAYRIPPSVASQLKPYAVSVNRSKSSDDLSKRDFPRSGSVSQNESFTRCSRNYATLPASTKKSRDIHVEDVDPGHYSDDEAVGLNGDWEGDNLIRSTVV